MKGRLGLTRRELISVAAAVSMAPALGRPAQAAVEQRLRDIAKAKGLHFGTAVSTETLKDQAYAKLVAEQCDMIVPEGELKWGAVERERGKLVFTGADRLIAFAEQHQMAFRGHTLIWHESLPPWVSNALTEEPGRAKSLVERHVSEVVGRYAGRVHSWDVVNEAIEPSDGRSDNLRRTPFLAALGPDYVDIAYRAAAAADPKALLVYNDNHLEHANGYDRKKRVATLRFLEERLKRGTPIQALGIQSHLVGGERIDATELRQFLDAVTGMGLKLLVTELDVVDQRLAAEPDMRDRDVAGLCNQYLDVLLGQPATIAVLTWGLSDRYSWLSKYKPRSDGRPARGALFDADMRPKQAFAAIAHALNATAARS